MKFEYFINLNERGYFNADVRNESGKTIWQIESIKEAQELLEDGFITDFEDIAQIEDHLKNNHFIDFDDFVVSGN